MGVTERDREAVIFCGVDFRQSTFLCGGVKVNRKLEDAASSNRELESVNNESFLAGTR